MVADTTPDGAGAPAQPSLLADPLEFLLADHLRQRNLCHLIDQLAAAAHFDPVLGAKVADYLAGEFALHMIDEEEDLFPLLRRRAEREDQIEEVLGALSGEHAEDGRSLEVLVEGLRAAVAAGTSALSAELRIALRAFAVRQRRHITVENALIVPLAEARLNDGDRRGLARRMAARRGWRFGAKTDAP